MKHLVAQHGLQEVVEIDSAGTSSYHLGEPADRRMRAAAAERGIELTSRSRMISPRDIDQFDLIVAMDRDNLRELLRMAERGQESKIKLLSDYLDETWPIDVPDPYYGGKEGFERVLDMLEAACPRILAAIQRMPCSH
ncbi:MAG: phosphotyrosine protein phosphatase [Pirellulaceae bacterium]|nr:MAG: phosphotyrosine protein phosphatase [Pirellulaceae bacterium]